MLAERGGAAQSWPIDKIRSYRRKDDDRKLGRFLATLLVNGKPLSIKLMLDYHNGKTIYRTTNPGSGGVVNGWSVSPALTRFLQPQFLNLFIFDGEFAERLLDGGDAEADRVVDALCQIYLLKDASRQAEEFWEASSRADTTRTRNGLNKKIAQLDILEAQEGRLLGLREDAEKEISVLEHEIKGLQERIDTRISRVEDTRRQHDKAKADFAEAQTAVAARSTALIGALRLPHAIHPDLAERLSALRDNLDRLRLPENTSAQFFNELLDEDHCICGRPMDEEAKTEIRSRASKYLDTSDSGVINALKQDIGRYTGDQGPDDVAEAGYPRVIRFCEDLSDAVRRENSAALRGRVLMEQLIEAGDKELGSLQAEKEDKERRRHECERLVAEINGPGDADANPETTRSLRVIRTGKRDLGRRIARIGNTVQLREQTEKIGELLDKAGRYARERIKQELIEVCNDHLSQILANDPLAIERIDKSIHLRSQQGASAGQTLAIGYTFLMSVLNRCGATIWMRGARQSG